MPKILALIAIIILLALALTQLSFAQEPTSAPVDNVDTEESEELAEDLVNLTVNATEDTTSTIEDFLDRLTTTPQSDLMRVLLVVGGVILLFAGWRVYDFVVVIAGFIIGASIAVSLVTSDSTLITIGAVLIGGLVGAALSVYLYFLAVFLIGAYIGIVLTGALMTFLSLTPVSPLVLFVGGLIGGVLMIGLSFEFLVFVSSLVGAQMLTLGLNLDVIWTIIFAIVGIILQLGLINYYHYNYRRRPVNPLRRVFA